ncbi:MAG: hypothetical protein K2I20_04220, partial [Clostridia bacterium]|nr:hypothetical protein [Clostridia bacterium]
LEHEFGLQITGTGAKFDILSGKDKFSFECISEKSDALLKELGIIREDAEGKMLVFGIDDALVSRQKSKLGYLKGAFLGGGSCTLPEEGTYSRT